MGDLGEARVQREEDDRQHMQTACLKGDGEELVTSQNPAAWLEVPRSLPFCFLLSDSWECDSESKEMLKTIFPVSIPVIPERAGCLDKHFNYKALPLI